MVPLFSIGSSLDDDELSVPTVVVVAEEGGTTLLPNAILYGSTSKENSILIYKTQIGVLDDFAIYVKKWFLTQGDRRLWIQSEANQIRMILSNVYIMNKDQQSVTNGNNINILFLFFYIHFLFKVSILPYFLCGTYFLIVSEFDLEIVSALE